MRNKTALTTIRDACHMAVRDIYRVTASKPMSVTVVLPDNAFRQVRYELAIEPGALSRAQDCDRLETDCGNAKLVIVRGDR